MYFRFSFSFNANVVASKTHTNTHHCYKNASNINQIFLYFNNVSTYVKIYYHRHTLTYISEHMQGENYPHGFFTLCF